MNQQNVELLSSEELETVTGGAGVVDVLTGVGTGLLETVGAPIFAWIPKDKCCGCGRFDTDDARNISKSITQALGSDMVAGVTIYGGYKMVSDLLCSKSGDNKETSPDARKA